jgi:hypothetical protein
MPTSRMSSGSVAGVFRRLTKRASIGVVPGQKKGKLRHYKDVPRRSGGVLGGNPPQRYSAPQSWEGKAEEVQELARRAAIKKKKC